MEEGYRDLVYQPGTRVQEVNHSDGVIEQHEEQELQATLPKYRNSSQHHLLPRRYSIQGSGLNLSEKYPKP